MIIGRDRVYWSRFSDSHENIIAEHELVPDSVRGPTMVRVELTPPENDFYAPLDAWVFEVDQDNTPAWFDAEDGERQARAALPSWVAAKVITKEMVVRLVDHQPGQFYMGGALKATFSGTGNTQVMLYGQAELFAQGGIDVQAHDMARVTARDHVTVTVFSVRPLVRAFDNVRVEAYSGNVEAAGHSHVVAYSPAHVKAVDHATVISIDDSDVHGIITVCDNATVIVRSVMDMLISVPAYVQLQQNATAVIERPFRPNLYYVNEQRFGIV